MQKTFNAGGAGHLGPPSHYNGIIFGDLNAYQADCEGALAVGGTATFGSTGEGFDVGAAGLPGLESTMIGKYDNPDGYPSLLLGGDISPQSTTSNVYAGNIAMRKSYEQTYESEAFKFGSAQVSYEEDEVIASFFTSVKKQACTIGSLLYRSEVQAIPKSNLISLTLLNQSLYLVEDLLPGKKVLIYNIDNGGQDTLQIGEIGFGSYVENYDAIVINSPAKKIKISNGAIIYNGSIINTSLPQIYEGNKLIGLLAAKLIFNFPQATEIEMANYGLIGTLLAPHASVEAVGGSLNGMIIAEDLQQDEGMELHAFTMCMGKTLWERSVSLGSITLQKSDETGMEKLQGAVFTLWTCNAGGGACTVAGTGTTDETGLLIFEDLPAGTYRLVENTPPPGYKLPDQKEWTVELTENDKGEVLHLETIYIKNTLIKGEISFLKLDYDNRELKLADVLFSLYQYDKDSDTYTLLEEDLNTDQNGQLIIYDLLPGDYKLVETQALNGYYLPDDYCVEFTIDATDPLTGRDRPEMEILNQKLAEVEIIKQDAADTSVTLEDAVFSLYLKDIDSGLYNVVSQGHATDANGALTLTGLKPGDYKLVETAAPQGYYLPENAETLFTVETDKDERILPVALISITNQQLGKIQFYKIDSDDDTIFL